MSSFELLEEQFSLSHHLSKQMELTLLIMMASATSHLGQLREGVGQLSESWLKREILAGLNGTDIEFIDLSTN
jgi:hypothetical protein